MPKLFSGTVRRARALHLEEDSEDAANKLNAPEFSDSVYITPFNKAVFFYAARRARKLAEATKQQLFWVQATDTPPAWFAGGYSKAELLTLMRKWLHFHARKQQACFHSCLAAWRCRSA